MISGLDEKRQLQSCEKKIWGGYIPRLKTEISWWKHSTDKYVNNILPVAVFKTVWPYFSFIIN